MAGERVSLDSWLADSQTDGQTDRRIGQTVRPAGGRSTMTVMVAALVEAFLAARIVRSSVRAGDRAGARHSRSNCAPTNASVCVYLLPFDIDARFGGGSKRHAINVLGQDRPVPCSEDFVAPEWLTLKGQPMPKRLCFVCCRSALRSIVVDLSLVSFPC